MNKRNSQNTLSLLANVLFSKYSIAKKGAPMMRKTTAPQIDEKALSKKYRTSVTRLISFWKKGKSDVEIATQTGIDLYTLRQIKTDIELAHRKLRLDKKKEALAISQASLKRQIFLTPLL